VPANPPMWRRRGAVRPSHLLVDEFAPSVGLRATIDLLERGRGAGPASPSPARAAPPPVPRTSGPGCWPSPQPSCCSAPRSPRNWPPRRDRAGGRGALQVDGEELTAGRRSPCGPRPASTGRRGPAPHRRGRPDCRRPGRAGPHHPHPRAGVGGDGGPEPNRPSRSRDLAPVDSGAGGRQSGGTWAVQPRQPALRVLRLGVDPPGRSQVRQYRPAAAGEEHPSVDREGPGPLRP
jgi:hypothetical protein